MAVTFLLFLVACELAGLIVYVLVRDIIRGLRYQRQRRGHRSSWGRECGREDRHD